MLCRGSAARARRWRSASLNGGRQLVRPRQGGRCCRSGQPSTSAITSFARVYSPMLGQTEDVRVVTFANVRDIRLDSQRGAIQDFACSTLEGTRFHVHAGRYVLALGGVENARLLLASRSQQPEGVANGH